MIQENQKITEINQFSSFLIWDYHSNTGHHPVYQDFFLEQTAEKPTLFITNNLEHSQKMVKQYACAKTVDPFTNFGFRLAFSLLRMLDILIHRKGYFTSLIHQIGPYFLAKKDVLVIYPCMEQSLPKSLFLLQYFPIRFKFISVFIIPNTVRAPQPKKQKLEQYIIRHANNLASYFLHQSHTLLYSGIDIKKLKVLGEITNLELLEEENELTAKIKSRPALTLLSIGRIDKRKEFFLFMQICLEMKGEVVPVVVGDINWNAFDEDQTDKLKLFFEYVKREGILQLGYIKDEPTFNSVLKAADIAFLFYSNPNQSSNIMVKAARLRVPFIADEESILKEDLKGFTDIIWAQKDITIIVKQIRQLKKQRVTH